MNWDVSVLVVYTWSPFWLFSACGLLVVMWFGYHLCPQLLLSLQSPPPHYSGLPPLILPVAADYLPVSDRSPSRNRWHAQIG